ncbi:MAG TPA: ABC transporter permease [Blastocatellia bacterium]|nr:ABC transporter permease [Blastocatellia bacterium]
MNTTTESEKFQADRAVTQESARVRRIEPSSGWTRLKLAEIWEYRELLYFLAWRDVKVRYKQTALGVAWAIIQPLLTMLVFSVFFGKLAKVPSDGIPYPIFCYTALVPWTLFANGLSQSSNSLVGSSNLITKVYFPRLIIPMSTALSAAVDFLFSFGVLFVIMVYYGVSPSRNILALPLFISLAVIASLGMGMWLSALNAQFRDVRYAVPFIIQFWMLATPIAYPSSLLGEPWRTLYGLNPMAGVVEGFRWSLLGLNSSPRPILIVSFLASLATLISGAFYFRRMEKNFADII